MVPMTDLATPLMADLQGWHDQQSPLVRALTEPLMARVTATLTAMQSVLDLSQAGQAALQAQVAAQAEVQAGMQARITSLETALALVEAQRDAQAALLAEVEAQRDAHAALLAEVEAQRDTYAALLAEAVAQRDERDAMAADLTVRVRVAQDRIDQLERAMYGQKSERRPRSKDARKLARERRQREKTPEQKEQERAAAAAARQAKIDALPTKTVFIPLGEDVPDGRPLPPQESEVLEWVAGHLVRVIFQREQRVLPTGGIVTAPPPPQVIEGGLYGPALHAKVAMDKCQNAMPLRRQERAFERIGAPLPISALCALFHRSAAVIEPVYKAFLAAVRKAEDILADETPQPVLDDEKVRKGWMWVFATPSVILFTFSPSRGGKVADAVLGESTGTLTVDGFTGYNIVTQAGRRQRGGCWSHARRGLHEARAYDETLVDGLLDLIGELFYVEVLAIEGEIVGTPDHLALRQKRSKDVVDRVYAMVEAHLGRFDSRASIEQALRYLVNQRGPLTLFLTNPRVPIHNNLSERELRIVALLRKNALFVGSDEGGRNLAMLLSMSATCRLHGVDPERWLADVLIGVQEETTVEPLLPWNWKHGRGLVARPVFATA